ncbi:MAG: hypothetical protein GY863_06070 [bacterium]|nr:hypothetical protein [bacterium]
MQRIKRFSQVLFSIALFSLLLTNAYGQTESQRTQIIKDEAFGISIDKPADWIHSYSDQGAGNRALYIRNNTEDAAKAVSILVFAKKPESKNVSEYAKKLINQYAKTYKKFDLSEKSAVLINDIPFASFLIIYEFEGITYKMNSVFTLQNDKIYQINVIASRYVYDSEKELINRIISSLKIQ